MDQRLATAVRHPLVSAASSTSPQIPLGDETPRNDEELPLGDETLGTKEDLHPLASAAASTPPQLPLGDKTPRNNPLLIAATSTAPASLGGRNPGDKFMETEDHAPKKNETTKKSFSWGTKPWGQKKSFPWGTKPQGQQQRQRPTFKGAFEQRQKRNDKDDAQPPRLRLTNQDFPPDLKMYFYVFTNHLLASAATLTPPQITLGDETPRNNPLASAASLAASASLGGQNPKE